jgi:hypothetical protein
VVEHQVSDRKRSLVELGVECGEVVLARSVDDCAERGAVHLGRLRDTGEVVERRRDVGERYGMIDLDRPSAMPCGGWTISTAWTSSS